MPKSTNEFRLFKSDMEILEKARRICQDLNRVLPADNKLGNAAVSVVGGCSMILDAGPKIDLTPNTQTVAK